MIQEGFGKINYRSHNRNDILDSVRFVEVPTD
jgi:hypothetical protein